MLIIAVGICLIIFLIQKQYKPSEADQETIGVTKSEKNEESSFTPNVTEKEKTEPEDMKVTVEYPDVSEIIPDESLSPEIYSPYEDDIQKECYFTNTENTIDVTGILPLYAQGILTEATQIWFNQNGYASGEIKCLDGTVQKTEEFVSFKAESADMIIVFTYKFDSRTWKIERGSL